MKWYLLILFSFLVCLLLANRSDTYLKKIQDNHPLLQKGCQAYFSGNTVQARNIFAGAIETFHQSENDSLLAMANMAYSICLTQEERQSEAIPYLETAYRLSKKVNESITYHSTLEALAKIHNVAGEFSKAIDYRRELLKLALLKRRRIKVENNLRTLATLYMQVTQPDSAYLCLEKAIKSAQRRQDQTSLTKTYGVMSLYYRSVNDYEKSLQYRMRQLEFLESLGKKTRFLANARLQIARIFTLTGDWSKAETYARSALEVSNELHLFQVRDEALSTIQEVKGNLTGKGESDIRQMEANLSSIPSHHTPKLVKALLDMGQAFQTEKHYAKADSCYREALYLLENHQEKTYRYPQVLYQLGTLMMELEEVKEAETLFTRASREAFSFGELQIYQKANNSLAEIYQRQDRYYPALQHLQVAYSAKDSLFSIEKERIIQETEARYQLAQKEKALVELNLQNEKTAKELLLSRKKEQMSGLGVLLLIGTLFFLLELYRQKKKNHRKLEFANAGLARSLGEKEFLLKEIHHRVKNNLQIISSMLSLQSDQIEDAKIRNAMREGQNRVESMVLIHEHLYQSENLQMIDCQSYIKRLTESLFRSHHVDSNQIHFLSHIDPIPMETDLVITLGLITNELISNALKYAFPNGRKGLLEINLRNLPQGIQLRIRDDGVGIPPRVVEGNNSTLGFQLVQAFVKKLRARINIQNNPGAEITIDIPETSYQKP